MNAANAATRVLVIDDEKGLRDMLSYTLRRRGCEVSLAESGEKGIAAVRAADFDVVICDIMMPGMGGVAVLEVIKRERPLAEIIMVAGFPTIEESALCLELGAFKYMDKPYDLMSLCAVLDSAAARKLASGKC